MDSGVTEQRREYGGFAYSDEAGACAYVTNGRQGSYG